MTDTTTQDGGAALHEVRDALRRFAQEREWERFHTPKNLAMALSGEVGELIEHFQWLPSEASGVLDERARKAVEEEVADVFLYLVRLADVLDIDVLAAARSKMDLNARRYPVAKARGHARKYDRLDAPEDKGPSPES